MRTLPFQFWPTFMEKVSLLNVLMPNEKWLNMREDIVQS
jgi:hypothetical protein